MYEINLMLESFQQKKIYFPMRIVKQQIATSKLIQVPCTVEVNSRDSTDG